MGLVKRGLRGSVVLLAAGAVTAGGVTLIGIAGAATPTVTLGSTSGTPSAHQCFAGSKCTYLPFTNVANPALQVPFNGTVTSFSINAGSAGGEVKLRVLRPAGAGKYAGAGTSLGKTLSFGLNTFAISLPVQAGDVLGLDNETSALMFDTSSATPIGTYFEPYLAEGATAAPTAQPGYRLLLSATVQALTVQSTTTTTAGTPPPGTPPPGTPPSVTGVIQSRHAWRGGNKLAQISANRKKAPPVGTTFTFTLNEQASVSFGFTQKVVGRAAGHKCVAKTRKNSKQKACKRMVSAGTLTFSGHGGTNKVAFQGRISPSKRLPPGSYTLVVTAANSAGHSSAPQRPSFTIVK
jgi:hypothetical protein